MRVVRKWEVPSSLSQTSLFRKSFVCRLLNPQLRRCRTVVQQATRNLLFARSYWASLDFKYVDTPAWKKYWPRGNTARRTYYHHGDTCCSVVQSSQWNKFASFGTFFAICLRGTNWNANTNYETFDSYRNATVEFLPKKVYDLTGFRFKISIICAYNFSKVKTTRWKSFRCSRWLLLLLWWW